MSYLWYRGLLHFEGGDELPFLLGLPSEEVPGAVALVVNGEEEIEVPVSEKDGKQELSFPHYDARVVFEEEGGELRGTWTRPRKGGETLDVGFTAKRVRGRDPRLRFPPVAEGERDTVSGSWAIQLDKTGVAQGVFRQEPSGVVTGTVLTPAGDLRYLAGTVQGRTLHLSSFDGMSAVLLTGALDQSGMMLGGELRCGAQRCERFTAKRASSVALPNPLMRVSLRAGETKLHLPALSDPHFRGKAVIVEVFGTWCPNCHDAAKLIKEIHGRFKDQGLEVLGLAFEYSEDLARSRRQVERFKERHGIDWPVVIAGTACEEDTSKILPQVSGIEVFPTTIFLNRDRTVRAIHSGFSGQATGARYEWTRSELERLSREIVGMTELEADDSDIIELPGGP